jgi:hypothetical protein
MNVTDDWLQHLHGITKLLFLDLSGTRVTDAGIRHLLGLKGFRYLDLRNTRVTSQGAFDQSLPEGLPRQNIRLE